jgi:hypothetical protein
VRAFIDALIAGRRPDRFRASPDEVEELRTAIALSTARPGAGVPDQGFVDDLWAGLQAEKDPAPPASVTPLRRPGQEDPAALASVTPLRRPGRNIIVSLAAAAAVVVGTVAVTEAVDHGTASRPAASRLPGHVVLTGTFVAGDNRKLGHVTVLNGSPSWVLMDVAGSRYDGPVTCVLEAKNGSVAASGTFSIQGGSGEWAKPLWGGVADLKGARLVAPTGVTLASATF